MTEEELLAEEYICNGKCQDDITRNYVHCKTCTRLKDFLAGYKAGKADLEKENAELKHTIATLRQEKDNVSMHTKAMEVVAKTRSDNLTKAKEIIGKLLSRLNRLTYTGLNCEECKEAEQFLKETK